MSYRFLWLAVGWMMVAAVVFVSLTPSPPQGPDFVASDKLMHGLTYLVLMGWFGQLYPSRTGIAMAGAGLLVMGAGLEILQGLDGAREASWLDGLANAAGVVCGWLGLQTRLGAGLSWVEGRVLGVGGP